MGNNGMIMTKFVHVIGS